MFLNHCYWDYLVLHKRVVVCSHPSRLILRVRSSHRFLVSTKMMVLFSFSAIISSISWINLRKRHYGAIVKQTVTNQIRQRKIYFVTSLLLVVLLTLHTDINYLKDVVIGAEFQGSNIDLDIVLQKVFSQLANLFRPRSTPHQGLSVRLGKKHIK